MKTVEQRIAGKQHWPAIALKSHLTLDVFPLWTVAKDAAERGEETVSIGLRNRKRAKTVTLAIGVTGTVNPGGYSCTVKTADLAAACEDETTAVLTILEADTQAAALSSIPA